MSLASIAAVSNLRPARADDPPSTDEPALPGAGVLPGLYQPSHYSTDPTTLRRVIFIPTGGGPTWPAVVLIHAGQYRGGGVYEPQEMLDAARDLNTAGYIVFLVDHRLAPPGLIKNQVSHWSIASGRPPQQTNDIKQQILAAKYHNKCNGTVFVIGGSSGAAHTAWTALDLEDTTNNGWGLSELPKAVVGLSGSYDLSSRLADTDEQRDRFIDIVENYTAVQNQMAGDPDHYAASAISRIALIAASNIPPMRLYNSADETMPHQQMETFAAALDAKGFTGYTIHTLVGAMHAFHCWPVEVSPGLTVGQDVIAFLNSHLL